MQTLKSLFNEISLDKDRWSYYKKTDFNIGNKWNSKDEALAFIESYFNYGGKSRCFEDPQLERNRAFVKERAPHIISTFLIGIKLFECFQIKTEPRDGNGMNLKYYWFLTCLYHDIGYAFEADSTCEQLRMLQSDGLAAIRKIADIQYLHKREFRRFSMEEIDLYLKGRAYCDTGCRGCVDHGIIGGLLLYDRLRKQFKISWKKRTRKSDSRDSFYIKDECHKRTLHLSNKHYKAYAVAADAIMGHNIWLDSFNGYAAQYDEQHTLKKLAGDKAKIPFENELSFILAIADTLEPLKRNLALDIVSIEALSPGVKIKVKLSDPDNPNTLQFQKSIRQLQDWVAVTVKESESTTEIFFTLSPLKKPQSSHTI